MKDANTEKKRHLQLIQDLEQEIRYNAKHHSQPEPSKYGTIRHIDGGLQRWGCYEPYVGYSPLSVGLHSMLTSGLSPQYFG